ncbi:MAG: dihydrolipoamide acetyltransferase [Rubripirellula sp.]|jgi:flagellar basal body-associated protein FliL
MAENEQKTEDTTPVASGLGGRGMIIAFVSVVVLMETAMFFFFIPSADEVSALAEERLVASIQKGENDAEKKIKDENQIKECTIGKFGETFSPQDTELTYRVEIEVYGLVKEKHADDFQTEFEEKEGRLRTAIRQKIRNSDLEELSKNNLGLLERRILTECNHLLKDDLLMGVGFTSYQLIEQ